MYIPMYQRSYDWDQTNVETLFNDLKFSYESDPSKTYFIGNIITREDRLENRVIIIDGQQRITTFVLFFLAIGNYIHFSGSEEPDISSKLFDDDFLKIYIYKYLDSENDELQMHFKINSSVKNQELEDAFKYVSPWSEDVIDLSTYEGTNKYIENSKKFYELIVTKLGKEKLLMFFDYIKNKVSLVDINLSKEMDENKIFESINAEGVPLNSVDLIKNYIYTQLEDKKISKMIDQNVFENLCEKVHNIFELEIGSIENKTEREQILKNYLAYDKEEFSKTKGKDFYKEFRNFYLDKIDDIEEFITRLECMTKIYQEIRKFEIKNLDTRFNVSLLLVRDTICGLFFPVLFEMFGKIDVNSIIENGSFSKLVNNLEIYETRRYIEGKTNKNYNKFFVATILPKMKKISQNDIDIKIKYLFEELLSYSRKSDNSSTKMKSNLDSLKDDFLGGTTYKNNSPQIKHILTKIEFNLKNESVQSTSLDKFDFWQIEHILPQTPEEDSKWFKDIDTYIQEKNINIEKSEYHKIILNKWGNLTLLEEKDNKYNSNFEWDVKGPNIKNNIFRLKDYFLENGISEWTPKEIDDRSNKLWDLVKINLDFEY